MNTERLEAWYNGKLADEKLSAKELRWLQKRVFKAILKKKLITHPATTFEEHLTLQ